MRSQVNKDIRDAAATQRVYLYEIAAKMDIGYTTLLFWLRQDHLSDDKRKRILVAIDDLAKERQQIVS